MNDDFRKYVDSSKAIAAQNEIDWNTPTNEQGNINRDFIWDLSKMAGSPPSPRVILKHLGPDRKTIFNCGDNVGSPSALPLPWIDLIKSVVIRKIYINRNKPSSIVNGIIRPLKSIAAVARDKSPWQISVEEVRQTIKVVETFDKSGKLSQNIISVARSIIDQNRLSDFSPITPPEVEKQIRKGRRPKEIRRHLSDRKSSKKLPYEDAFWEVIRIAWTETPVTSLDHARFAMIRLLVLTGMRISEVSTIPLDCLKWIKLTQNYEGKDIPLQARTKSLALKHFASKMRSNLQDSVILFETVQHVPDMYKDPILDLVETYKSYSEPMRDRIRLQSLTNRVFPEFDTNEIVPAFDFYTRLTGEPFLYVDPLEEELMASWKETYDLEILQSIEMRQKQLASAGNLINRVRQYFQMRLRIKREDGTFERAPFVDADGLPYNHTRLNYDDIYFRVGELEKFIRRCMPTKLSDLTPLKMRNNRELPSNELLFLSPKRALGESRNGRICDVRKYAFVGTIQPNDLSLALTNKNKTTPCLFETYGKDENSKKLSIKSHEFRHLQNTELFRLGVSDAIITKRFNRNSIQQSHVYDHRSLAEDLKSIEIPEKARTILSGKAEDTFRMILAGLASGPIIDEFKNIQKHMGDESAYKFLAAEADGLHTTPYGHCVNSFTVDPCPKHLECFSGCLHLTRSPLTEHTKNLEKVRDRFETLLKSVADHPAPAAAKEKMRSQAEVRLAGVNKMLETSVGSKVFPDGIDISRSIKKLDRGPFRD